MIRVFLLVVAILLHSLRHSAYATNAEKVVRVEEFLADVNLSEPKVFYIRNNLDGDVIIQENDTASLVVHLSANDEEMKRMKVDYSLIDGGGIVDIQVYIAPEATANWPLIGRLAGAVFLFAVIVVMIIVLFKKRKKKRLLRSETKKDELDMEELSVVTAGKDLTFEKPDGRERKMVSDENVGRISSRPVQSSPLIQRNDGDFPISQRSRGTPPKTSRVISVRPVLMVITLVAVALATSKAPSARIVINVPASFVKNGSKIFFNKDFHGRLLLSEGLRGRMQKFQQFAVSQASNKVSSLDSCFNSCKFACDVQAQQCICLRGYEIEGDRCQDVDECISNKHNCHVHATCKNTIGRFNCTCSKGYWGDGVKCYACSSKPCPQGFYQSSTCSRTRDRICSACSSKCEGLTYEAFGCGLTFDRKCVDISKPLTLSKTANESDHLRVRSGSWLTVLHPAKSLVLLEDRLRLKSTSAIFVLRRNSSNQTSLHRNSSFYIDVEIEQVNFVPKYKDYDAWRSNGENLEFAGVQGFAEVFTKHCRYPAPNHYTLKHDLHRNRQTKVYQAMCFKHSRSLCPDDVSPGEMYHFRSLNDACDTAENSIVCRKPNQRDCRLEEDLDKLYCTNYTNIISDVFGIKESEFLDNPLQSFPTTPCAWAYRTCSVCRDSCSNCDKSNNQGKSSCSCCYKNCLDECSTYYSLADCTRIPKKCAKGDTSQFTLTMNKPTNLNLQFNCFLQYDFPEALYTLKYRVRHESGRFNSSWVFKTLKMPRSDNNALSKIQQGTNRLDFLEVSHATNFDISSLLYMRGQRRSEQEPYIYSITSLNGKDVNLGKGNMGNTINFQTKTPFAVTTKTWNKGENCHKLSEWPQSLRKTFLDLKPAKVEHLGIQSGSEFSYRINDPQLSPTMTVSISENESVLKYVLTNASIRNDETFESSLSRGNTSWNVKLSGILTSCPGFFTLQVVDEVDSVKVLEQDVVVLCPEIRFKLDIRVPRNNLQDKEKLFSICLSDNTQKLKLQLALVDKNARTSKESKMETKNQRPNTWGTLIPLFVLIGCVLLGLFALMSYAQLTHKPDNDSVGSTSDATAKTRYNRHEGKPKDENRLKKRHLILVVFFLAFRVAYSLVFSFSMAFAILTLLHGPNLQVILEYQEFVQSKIDESNAMALQMDQHREREIKRILDSTEGIQRSCDFYLGLQLQWLRYNMTCLIQENHVKMFNKLTKKIVKKATEKVKELKKAIDNRIKEFQGRATRKLQDTKESLKDYGRRVYDNGWFSLPRGAYKMKKAVGRKRRDVTTNIIYQSRPNHVQKIELTSELYKKTQHAFLTRTKRSLGDSSFIRFLDFVGALDQEKLVETENKIKAKLQYVRDGLADFSEVLVAGKSPEHPLSTILMCPLRFMFKTAKEQLKRGIRKIEKEGEEWARSKAACFSGNISDFFGANYSTLVFNATETNSEFFSERIAYEDIAGLDGIESVSKIDKSSIIESAHGGFYFNVEKGDIMEEQVDEQKRKLLEREGKIKNVTSVYDADVFITTKKAILGVVVVIDILLLIYRATKTYKIVVTLIQGFEETVKHDEDEFKDKLLPNKQRTKRLVRRVLDFLARKVSTLLSYCKTLHKRIMRTNLLPICIVVAASAAVLYLLVAIVFNVMNVAVIEELGGYDLIASRLDTDFNFTNLAIADQVDFINHNEMRLYKESMHESLSEYNKMIVDFNRGQQDRIEQLNRRLCSLENDTEQCLKDMELTASLLSFEPQSCIIPTLEGTPYEDFDGNAYRQRLKQESKRFVDAIRNIVLETIYFIVGVVLLVAIISILSFVAFLFLKSRGMVRVRQMHVYKTLPHNVLRQFYLKSCELKDDETDGKKTTEEEKDKPKTLKAIYIILAEPQENAETIEHSSYSEV